MSDTFPTTEPNPYEPVPPEPPSTTWSNGRIAAILIGLIALVGGTFLAISAATGGSDGPEEAVEDLFEAIADEDVIGVLGALDPEERDAIEPGIRDLANELTRLGVFSDDLDLEAVSGIDVEFDDVELETRTLTDDLVAVTVVGGTATTSTDPAQAPLGRLFDDTGVRENEPTTETDELEPGDETTLVAIRRDGWHVSIGWSILEAARGDEGFAFPDPAQGLEPQGADSPSAAVDTLFRSGAALDVERVIALLAPGEVDPLHAAAPLFLADARQAIETLTAQGVSIELTELELSETEIEGGVRVIIEQFGITISAPDIGTISYEFDGECTRITGLEDSPLLGVSPLPFGLTFPLGEEICPGDIPPEQNPFAGIFPETDVEAGIVVVEHDGEWFVSPTRTLFDGVNQFLRALPDDGIEQLIAAFQGMFASATQEFETVEGQIEVETGGFPEECRRILEGGGTIDECPDVPNPMQPGSYEFEQSVTATGQARAEG